MMNSSRLILRSAAYHWRTNAAVVLGVAAAVSVLSGALLVGDSVRGSLRDLAVGRLGHTDVVVSSSAFFRERLAQDIRARAGTNASTAPLLVADGFVTQEASGRRASRVAVYGVDDRFWSFHGVRPGADGDQTGVRPGSDAVFISPALASELGANADDVLLVRLQKPSAIPIESLFGRKDDTGRTVRVNVSAILGREEMGEFSLRPQQSNVRAIFLPLRRIQRDLGISGTINTILVAGVDAERTGRTLREAVTLDDLGAKVSPSEDPASVIVESTTGILGDTLEAAARQAADHRQLPVLRVFTYLANSIRKGDREIPYSLISAIDPGWSGRVTYRTALPECGIHANGREAHGRPDTIMLNTWAAAELAASGGDRIEVDYYLWDPAAGLTTHTAAFTADCVEAPLTGLTGDRRLAPEFPGITSALTLASWDPPFPVDFGRVRPRDEQYWKDYRTTPKALIPFERGRELWKTRYGSATSIRIGLPEGSDATLVAGLIDTDLRAALQPRSMGITISAARAAALDASRGTTDFGEYFTYFSFFIVVSAVLLATLFFRLGIEQRLRQIGILRAAGFTIAHVRRLLGAEALLLAAAGSALGIAGAIAYAQLIVFALRTWWVGAVGTTLLTLHVSPVSLLAGAVGGLVTAAAAVALSLRGVARLTPRALLSAHALDSGSLHAGRARRGRLLAWTCTGLGLVLIAIGFTNRTLQTGMFFGGGAMLLAACMVHLASWLRRRDATLLRGGGAWALWRLGFRSAASRPARSILSVTLIASAAFIIVSVDAFRRGDAFDSDIHSGTGGYALIAQSEVPILSSPNDAAGREALVVNAPEFERIRFTRFRLRPGEDASCLNLYRPNAPTIVAPERGFIESGRFTFGSSLAATDAERTNPWLLLNRPTPDDIVPVIADATSLQYALHAAVGDTFSMDLGGERPLVLRFVGALRDSVLQGELVMSEENFVRLFPAQQGYRFFLIDDPAVHDAGQADAVAGTLERELAPFGFDAVTTAERLASFHRVENTYLSTFQALGGLGLLLGTIGLSAIMFRNVLERRRELALLRAVGYDARHLSTVIVAEAGLLLGFGLAAGVACAALAVAPAWLGRGGTSPGPGLLILLGAVAVAGLISSLIATRAALRGNMLAALRAE